MCEKIWDPTIELDSRKGSIELFHESLFWVSSFHYAELFHKIEQNN